MATVEKFEDLAIWQEAVALFKLLYLYTEHPAYRENFRLRDQIRSSAGSIADNIAEGFERAGKGEFLQSLYIAKGEAGELRSQLIRSREIGLLTDQQFEKCYEMVTVLSRRIFQLTEYLKKTDYKGLKFKDRKP
ncbi:MAG: four helix bundle protein [Bacteroidetes bacterium]|nr:four helix bundle protein [Bacteroidota bacterium]HOA38942.1 four helix bundle protein [Flavihumibacter sp.]